MKVKYTECPKSKTIPCFMENAFGEIFLVTNGIVKDVTYVTRINCEEGGDMETWESDLKDYVPLPKGTKVELVN